MSLNAAVTCAILAMSASYAAMAPSPAPPGADMSGAMRAAALAARMAQYRGAVIAYHSAHPGQYGSVSAAALQAAGALPYWQVADGPGWQNYRGGDGVIYVYAPTRLPLNLTAALLAASDNSVMVGRYSAGQPQFISALAGATAFAAPPAMLGIPDGAPVWLAQAN